MHATTNGDDQTLSKPSCGSPRGRTFRQPSPFNVLASVSRYEMDIGASQFSLASVNLMMAAS
jgi:hypothetical protein